jgi:hypothetical protein
MLLSINFLIRVIKCLLQLVISMSHYLAQYDCLAAEPQGQWNARLTLTPPVIPNSSGFGGLVVSMLAFVTQDRGFAPSQNRRIFQAKNSSAYLPLEGKYIRLPHVADLRHVKNPIIYGGCRKL